MLPNIASRILNTPLLIHRAKLDAILAAIGPRLGVDGASDAVLINAASSVPKPLSFLYKDGKGIAVVPIYGTLVKRTLGLEAVSGLMSYQEINTALGAALADPAIRGILFDIDSPGGEVSGCFELARRVREAAQQKPVWAIANDSAFSAAYAIGSAAQRIYVTETGGVGSIGVIALHVDQSAKDQMEGLKYTAIYAGQRKNDYSPHEPLSDEARAALQAEVDRLYGIFVNHVAEMRSISADAVRATEAALYFGENAVTIGLADGVETLDSVLDSFYSYIDAQNRTTSVTLNKTLKRAQMQERIQEQVQEQMQEQMQEQETITVEEAIALVAETRREVAETAQAIAELCMIAGCPEKAAAFIAEGKTEAEVRKALLEAKAAQSEAATVRSTIMPDAGTDSQDRPETSPVVKAVKKLVFNNNNGE